MNKNKIEITQGETKMKQIELVIREILYKMIEKKERKLTQSGLSKEFGISLSVVNLAVRRLNEIGAVKILQRSFNIIDARKIIYFWASIRNLKKDIIFNGRVEMSVREIERNMPANIIFSAYSAYKFRFKDVPADYSEVYVYADEKELEIIKKRFVVKNERPNLFILKKDSLIDKYKEIPIAQIFVDLWNIGEWYAKDFVDVLEKKIEGFL